MNVMTITINFVKQVHYAIAYNEAIHVKTTFRKPKPQRMVTSVLKPHNGETIVWIQ